MTKKRAKSREFDDVRRVKDIDFTWDDGVLIVSIHTASGVDHYGIGPAKTLRAIEQAKRTLQGGMVLPFRERRPEH